MAAQRVIAGEADIFVAGGVESISCVQNEMNKHMIHEAWLKREQAGDLLAMLQTAETVAKRYGIGRERRTATARSSQQRAAARKARASSTTRSCRSR
jgi:acetyl-CoA C-acetyltransferase